MKTSWTRMLTLAFTLSVVPALGACNRDADVDDDAAIEPGRELSNDQTVRVTEVDLGRAVGSDGRINDDAASDEFRPNDTIYVSIDTQGTASGTRLGARWTYEDGQVVDESSQTISPTGPTVTHFHITKPDGFPTGKYKVEIQLNGQTVESKDFEVK